MFFRVNRPASIPPQMNTAVISVLLKLNKDPTVATVFTNKITL